MKACLFSILILFQCLISFGQALNVELSNNEIQLNETFSIKVSITNDKIRSYKGFPEISGFQKGGISQSNSMKIINGDLVSSHSILQYYIPLIKGEFFFKGFILEVNGMFVDYPGGMIKVTNNKLIEENSSDPSELKSDLGEYLILKDHPKSKGVNLKLRPPIGWEVKEGDRPNIVQKFTKEENTYLILIKENGTFFSRNQVKELLEDEIFTDEFIQESGSIFQNLKVVNKSVVTIDTYPALQFKVKGMMEHLGLKIPMIMECWIVFYEDKMVSLQSMRIDKAGSKVFERLYFLITNSVIFPDQYN